MRAQMRLALFAAGLLILAALGFGVGRISGPFAASAHAHPGAHDAHTHDMSDGQTPADVGGLEVSQAGYRLVPLTTTLTTGTPTEVAFRVLDPSGMPLRQYTRTHTKDLHLIVVRRDLAGFQHLHPELRPDGTWYTTIMVTAAGQYRLIADFQPTGRDTPLALGVDLPAAGPYQPLPLPDPARVSDTDGYQVTLTRAPAPGGGTATFAIARAGRPVADLQPYLGADAHLVALRAGDLAYLHTHPLSGAATHGPQIIVGVPLPGPGTYRLYLEFAHRGTVHTAEFTVTA